MTLAANATLSREGATTSSVRVSIARTASLLPLQLDSIPLVVRCTPHHRTQVNRKKQRRKKATQQYEKSQKSKGPMPADKLPASEGR
jgi:hypothetical protein